MIAVVTILSAFPLGFLVRSRLAANVAYTIAYLWAFTFQTLYLLLDALKDADGAAFTPEEFPLSYGVVALGILVAGLGLVEGGHRVQGRRRSRAGQAVLT